MSLVDVLFTEQYYVMWCLTLSSCIFHLCKRGHWFGIFRAL